MAKETLNKRDRNPLRLEVGQGLWKTLKLPVSLLCPSPEVLLKSPLERLACLEGAKLSELRGDCVGFPGLQQGETAPHFL